MDLNDGTNDGTNGQFDQEPENGAGLENGTAKHHEEATPLSESGPENGPENGAGNGADSKLVDDLIQQLNVSGLIYTLDGDKTAVEVRRGMKILTTEGEVAGTVAGVIHNSDPRQVQYILLSRPSQQIEYRMVPIELVRQVSNEIVSLHILAALVSTLPPWHS